MNKSDSNGRYILEGHKAVPEPDLMKWGCMSEFTEAGILYAVKVIMERDIDYQGRQMQAIYNRRSQEKKRNEEGEESA